MRCCLYGSRVLLLSDTLMPHPENLFDITNTKHIGFSVIVVEQNTSLPASDKYIIILCASAFLAKAAFKKVEKAGQN
jgi:hypothetical protein